MKRRLCALVLAALMLAGMLPTQIWAAGETAVEGFFTDIADVVSVDNTSSYPFTVGTETEDGPWLQSTNQGKSATRSTLTLTMQKAATLTFDYKISSPSSSGLEVKNGSTTLYTYSSYGSSGAVTGCSGEKFGTATVQAEAEDIITISYYRGYYSHDTDCLWLKNFQVTLPNQVILHANNGTDETQSQGIFGTGTLMANPFAYKGHIFKGWATSQGGEVAYQDGGEITLAQDTDLYAVWAPVYDLSFTLTPSDADFALYSDAAREKELAPNGGGLTYTLEKGTYYWAASAFGYESGKNEVTITDSGQTVAVALTAQPAHIVAFQYGDPAAGIENGSLSVVTGEREMTPQGDGMTYSLPVGYVYSWTFRSGNYAKQTGVIDLSAQPEEGEQSVTIPLTEKMAWDGADDILEPQIRDGVYQISSGAELAWLAQEVNAGRGRAYNAVLTRDIDLGGENWTPIGKNYTYRYAGIFDGQGYTVTGLKITASTAGNYGLFGYVEGGTVRGVTVEGEINVASGSSSYGTGGIVGQLSGTAGAVESCVNKAAVSGAQNVGGVVGAVTSGYSTANKSIQSCASLGAITSAGNNAGGIVGYVSGQVNVSDCYNRGDVIGGGWRAGGITAYSDSSYASFSSCYTTGAVNGSDSAPVIGKFQSGTVDKETLYYLNTLGSDPNATAKTEEEMKSPDFVSLLGAAFQKDLASSSINDGYPILTFQDPTPKYDVIITVTPADADVRLVDGGESVMNPASVSDGAFTYRLPDGTYKYSVSAFGYTTESGKSIVVSGAATSDTVTLTPSKQRGVVFSVSPADAAAQITVTYTGDGRTVQPSGDRSYSLPGGSYHYMVKAKGYARQEGDFTVNALESGVQTISVTLTASAQWDGESQDEPAQLDGVYQISSGAELAWLAAQVNSSADISHDAVLTDDIDLGDESWTPIGGSGSPYTGTFDGGGYTVSGLKVSGVQYAGLFGYIKGASASQQAVVKNVVVQGSVSGTDEAGGIAARVDNVVIENCGNEAEVTSGDYAGGIAARQFSYNAELTISGCYNTGGVTGKSRAGGVLGYVNYEAEILNCYNTGSVSASSYAGGIRAVAGSLNGSVEGCYNAGSITGSTKGAIVAGSGKVTNCYYLSTYTADSNDGSTAKTSDELKNIVADLNGGAEPAVWKSVSDLNQGYPVLAWQTSSSGETGGRLNKATGLAWQTDEYGLDTGVATWNAVPNADSYTVILWDFWARETDYGAENGLSAVKRVEGVKAVSYDFTAEIEANGPSWYYFTVTPIAAEASGYESGALPVWDESRQEGDLYSHIDMNACYRYAAQLDMPTGLTWSGPMARWGFVDDAAGYLVALYRVDESNTAQYAAGGIVDGNVNTLDCTNYFAVGGRYVFTVTALSEEYVLTGIADKNSPESRLSSDESNGGMQYGVYTAQAVPDPSPDEPDRSDWVAISSAEQWMELANVEDIPTDDDPLTSRQAVEWSKKYYLTADLDFSGLTAADQARTKSIGNTQNRFTGIMDGNGHKLTGLTLSNYDSGLFAYIGSSGQVYDITIEGANVQFSDNAAVLALNNYGTIRDCLVVNCNITADTGAVLGGMVSRNYGIVQDSAVQGGELKSNSLTATGHAGFVGANEGGLIERCWTSMDVDTQSDYAGGFIGLGYGGTIRSCFALGDVSARGYSGGFAGRSVYDGNTYQSCYAAGVVTVSESGTGHGFIGGNKPDSAFQADQSKGVENCYYNVASPTDDNGAQGKTLAEMQGSDFLIKLAGASGVWLQAADKNGGLPYLNGPAVPEDLPTSAITVQIALAAYDKSSYAFSQMGQTVSVTLQSSGNTRVVDVMDAAAAQGLLTYSYDTTPTFGRYVHTINGYAVEDPDGWMFTINDSLSNVSASLATVQDGARILWYEGTTENRFLPPSWDELGGEDVEWIDIDSVEKLLALTGPDADPSAHYRLTASLDLSQAGEEFAGIGTLDNPFTGVFDGQGHAISGVSISGGENAGFFGVIKGATIKNLTLEKVSVSGTKNVGALVGWAQAELDKDNMAAGKANLIGNCAVSGAVSGEESVGGLVGLNGGDSDPDTLFSISSAIDKCTADVAVTCTGSGSKIGGLVGDNSGVITKSAALGDVTAENATSVGGLAGDSYSGSVYDSHAEGGVIGDSFVGGFAGSSNGVVRSCYSLGGVSGKNYTGGFAGSLAQADNVISAGQVTVLPGGSQGYNGGLAGQLTGTLTGVANQITVKNAYANCQTPDGSSISIIGNTHDYQSDSQKDVLASLTLDSKEVVGRQLYDMFGVNLPVSGALEQEAAKYAQTVFAGAAPGQAISLLKEGQMAGSGITAAFEADGDYLTGGSALTLAKANDTAATMTIPVVVALTEEATGDVYRITVNVALPAGQDAVAELMDAIAVRYTESSDGWTVMDMAAYSALPSKTAKTSDLALQNAVNLLITEAAGNTATASDRARIEIVLRAMGIDSTKLYAADSAEPFSNAQRLAGMDLTSGGYYAAPYLLLAGQQGSLQLTDSQTAGLISLLKSGMGDGLFGYEWDGVTYSDPDTAGIALAALARLYDGNADAKSIVDAILSALPGALDSAGSLGSANSDAMVILGLLALDKDPYGLKAPSGASIVDGLLSYVNLGTGSFQFGGTDNALATEQGFRALVGLAAWEQGAPYNIYDFSAKAVVPGRATGSGEVTPPDEPETDKTVTITFTLKTDTEIWVPATAVTVKEGSTVYHVFDKAIRDRGDMSAVGAASGYVKSVSKGGVTLAEYDKGPNSGWLFKVNGKLPSVGLTSCPVYDGDSVLFYYTADWTQDPQAGSAIGGKTDTEDHKAADAVSALIDAIGDVTADSGEAIRAARAAYDALTAEQKKLVDNYDVLTAAERRYAVLTSRSPFDDIAGHWAFDAICYVYDKGLMNGVGGGAFAPEQSLDRAMLVTILYRLDGEGSAGGENSFSDVAAGSWYADAVLWASQNGIVNGYGGGVFGPADPVTREQMAAILYRYARHKGYDTGGAADLGGYADASNISAYAEQATRWAVSQGLITGDSADTLSPAGKATRAEAAAILMRFCEGLVK